MSTSLDHFTGIPHDTTPDAFRVQCDMLRRLSPSQRLQTAFELTQLAESLAAGGIRRQHPDYNAEQVRLALARMRLGDDLFRVAYPDVEVSL